MTVKTYQDLIAWQKAIALVTVVYEATRSFQRDEVYGLTSQHRRAAVSILSNIAEGQGRASSGEFIQFLCHARGSLYEVETQIIVANLLNYLSNEQRDPLIEKISELGRILNGLITSLQSRKKRISGHQPLATSH
jgi:four helix bundle protein